jgi:hypothetical protein
MRAFQQGARILCAGFAATALAASCSSASEGTGLGDEGIEGPVGFGGSTGAAAGSGSGDTFGAGGYAGDAPSKGGSAGASSLGEGCASETHSGKQIPVDLMLLVDRSGSMDETGKWDSVTGALASFVQSPGAVGIGVGLNFFPPPGQAGPPLTCSNDADCGAFGPCESLLGGFGYCDGEGPECEKDTYKNPFPITPLPEGAGPIINYLQSVGPDGGTPTLPALTGVIESTAPFAAAHPDHAVFIVLATDGAPSGCGAGNTVEGVAAIAAQAASASPSLRTFVIGVGGDLDSLNAVAAAGGTTKATFVSGTDATAAEFLAALDAIRGTTACRFALPVPTGGQAPDYAKVNLELAVEGGGSSTVPSVANAAACGTTAGWYYDNPAAPSQIVLCEATCTALGMIDAKINVVLGCATVLRLRRAARVGEQRS